MGEICIVDSVTVILELDVIFKKKKIDQIFGCSTFNNL